MQSHTVPRVSSESSVNVPSSSSKSKDLVESRTRQLLSSKEDAITEETNNFSMTRETELVPPDGGWGWMVLFGGFVTLILTNLPLSGFGIIFAPIFSQHKVSSTNIAWIFNTHAFIWNVNVVVVGPFCEEFGWRRVAIVGGVFSSLAVILSGLVPRFELLFLTHSVLGAIGGCIGTSVCMFVVSQYFVKRRGFALGIMTLGVCTGSFTSPLLLNFLLENFAYRGASLIFGGIMLNQCVAGALYHPVKWHMKRVGKQSEIENKINDKLLGDKDNVAEMSETQKKFYKERQQALVARQSQPRKLSENPHYSVGSLGHSISDLAVMSSSSNYGNRKYSVLVKKESTWRHILKLTCTNLKSLRSTRVLFIALAAACMMMGYVNFQMWIPFAVRDAGHSLELSAWSLAIAATANTVARVMTSAVSDCSWFNIRIGYMCGLAITAVAIIVFALSTSIHHIFACVAIWGFSIGIVMALYPTVMIKTMGLEMFPAVFGISSLFIAFFFIIVGPIIGMIRDMTSSNRISLVIIAGMVILAFVFWLLMPFATRHDMRKEEKKFKLEADPS